ncbi:MAG: hypothetical protein ACE5E7_13975 [Anaerolineae bacterium]
MRYDEYAGKLEDFWGRRATKPRFRRDFRLYGHPVQLLSNEEGVLTAVDHTRPLYSTVPDSDHSPFTIQITVQPARVPPGPAPDDLMQRILYSGDGDWLMLHLGGWGHAHVDLAQFRATAVLVPELAQRPDLVSQCLLNTILLNFCIASGFGMLHASCLVQNGRALLLLAPHNSGKSTTALRLALAGWRLLSDSMVFTLPGTDKLVGFPVGKIKLRRDMVAQFPPLQPLLAAEAVRDETKFSLDLRRVDETLVQTTAVAPARIDLCLLARHNRAETLLKPADETAVWEAVMMNSLYYDQAAVWRRNLAQLEPVIGRARAYHLTIGVESERVIKAIQTL